MDYLDQQLIGKLRQAIGERFGEIFGLCLDHVETELQLLCDALARADLQEVGRLAHASKGSVASMGACGLASALAGLVEAARSRNSSECAKHLSAIPELLAATRSTAISCGLIKQDQPYTDLARDIRNHQGSA